MERESADKLLQEAARRAIIDVQSVRHWPVTASAQALHRLDDLLRPLPRAVRVVGRR